MSHKVFKILINAIVCLTVLFLFSLITQKFIEIKTLSNVIFRSVPISYTLKSKEIQKDFLTRYIIVVEKNTLVYKVKVDKQIYYYLNTKLPNLHYNKK